MYMHVNSDVVVIAGNYRNLPMTVANKYQRHQYAQTHIGLMTSRMKILGEGNGVEVNGTKYVLGDTIVVGMCHSFGQPLFGEITEFEVDEDDVVFTCVQYDCDFNSHYHAFEIHHLTAMETRVSHSNLLYNMPASVLRSDFSGDFICVRYGIP